MNWREIFAKPKNDKKVSEKCTKQKQMKSRKKERDK